MAPDTQKAHVGETAVTLRYWAAARAAIGVASEELRLDGAATLAEVVDRVVAAHPGPDVARVLTACSVLIGDRPVGSSDPATVQVQAGDTLEFLPPFAGG